MSDEQEEEGTFGWPSDLFLQNQPTQLMLLDGTCVIGLVSDTKGTADDGEVEMIKLGDADEWYSVYDIFHMSNPN